MSTSDLKGQVALAINALEDKKGENVAILQMERGAFTDYLLLASGGNPRQVQAMSDEVELRLKRSGIYPNSIEGYQRAEWILLDYVDFVVQIFDTERRSFYDLDRLWKSAKRLMLNDLKGKVSRAATSPVPPASSGTRRKRASSAIGRAAKNAVRTATAKRKVARTSARKTKPKPASHRKKK